MGQLFSCKKKKKCILQLPVEIHENDQQWARLDLLTNVLAWMQFVLTPSHQ
jgi:hypothetical protein